MDEEAKPTKSSELEERINKIQEKIRLYSGEKGRKKIEKTSFMDSFMNEVQGNDLCHFEEELLDILKPFIEKTGVKNPSKLRKGLAAAFGYKFTLKSIERKAVEWGFVTQDDLLQKKSKASKKVKYKEGKDGQIKENQEKEERDFKQNNESSSDNNEQGMAYENKDQDSRKQKSLKRINFDR